MALEPETTNDIRTVFSGGLDEIGYDIGDEVKLLALRSERYLIVSIITFSSALLSFFAHTKLRLLVQTHSNSIRPASTSIPVS